MARASDFERKFLRNYCLLQPQSENVKEKELGLTGTLQLFMKTKKNCPVNALASLSH